MIEQFSRVREFRENRERGVSGDIYEQSTYHHAIYIRVNLKSPKYSQKTEKCLNSLYS